MLTIHTDTRPQLDFSAIDRADLAPSTCRKYKAAITALVLARVDPFDSIALADYAQALPHSSRAHLKASLSIMADEYSTHIKANATPELVAQVQAMIWRLEAMDKAIHIQKPEGTKIHVWLSQSQVDVITALPFSLHKDNTRAMRDYIVLAVLLGAGLRREELENLTFDSLKRLPNGSTYRDVLEITGKGDKPRVVPISPLLSQRLHEWKSICGPGHVARSINKAGKIGSSLSAFGIFTIVRQYGAMIDRPQLDPHDCRRSFGRLGWEATHDLMLIRDLLGHKDARTTQEYIGLNMKLDVTASDFIIRSSEFFGKVSGD